MNSHIHIGTCAWTFEDWNGTFYPADLPASRRLAFYAGIFSAVEINATFYANPSANHIARWLAETPAHFRFTCKAPKLITHEMRLRGADQALEDFLESMQPLHGRMGPILFQLPPDFEPERDAAALRDFVIGLPHGWRYAIEFRHPDWHQPRFAKLLEDHNVCWTWSDTSSVADQARAPFEFLPETADVLYVRLMGDLSVKYNGAGDRNFAYREVLWSRAAAIESWAVRLHKQAEHVRNIYILCSNHYEGFAPATCRAFAERLGVKVPLPVPKSLEPVTGRPQQMKLL